MKFGQSMEYKHFPKNYTQNMVEKLVAYPLLEKLVKIEDISGSIAYSFIQFVFTES